MPHIKPKHLHPQRGTGYHGALLGIAEEAIAENDLVIAIGYDGERIKFRQADTDAGGRDIGIMGVADHAAGVGESLRVVSYKLIKNVDTSAVFAAGSPVYVSDTAGGWSAASGAVGIVAGQALEKHASTGAVLLAPGMTNARMQKKRVIALTNATTTARTMLADESGALVTLDPNTNTATTITVTLPAIAGTAGIYYDFAIIKDMQHTGADIIINTAGASEANFVGFLTQGTPQIAEGGSATHAASVNVLEIAHGTITFDASVSLTTGNTKFQVISDGVQWIISGNSTAVSGVTNPVLSN